VVERRMVEEDFVRAVGEVEWRVVELVVERRRELERRREGVGQLSGALVVVDLWVEEGLWSARRGLGPWTGGGFRRFCAEDGSCEVNLLARLLCLG
jgi:hypothetical protein